MHYIIKNFGLHIALILLTVFTIALSGCGSMSQQRTVNHEVEIVVSSATDTAVTVEEYDATAINLDEFNSDSPLLRPTAMTSIAPDVGLAFVKIYAGLSVSDVHRLWNDMMYLKYKTDIKKVILFINSGGGEAFSGLALADIIIRAQAEGITFEANASGIIASAAVPVFAVCDYRIAAKGTIFMVHEAALWKWPGRETSSDIRAQNELMILLQDRYLGYLVGRSKLSLEKWQMMEKATTWFSAEKALTEIGIVDEIK
jgi:ATP-dependent protease ClpP protease subunit